MKFKPKSGDPETCEDCGVFNGSYHKLGCTLEISPCGKHKYVVNCVCDVRDGEPV